MFHVSVYSLAESLFRALHEVASAPSVAVDFNSAGHHIHPFGIEKFCSYHGEVAVGHFKNLVVAHQHRPILKPSLGRKDFSVYNLCKHDWF